MQNQNTSIISKKFNDDRDFVLYLLQCDPFALRYNFPKLQDDLDFALAAVECNAVVLPFVSERLQNHFKLVQKAIEHHPWTLIFASEKLRKRSYFQEFLMKRDTEVFLCQSSEIILSTLLKMEITQFEEILLYFYSKDRSDFKRLIESIQSNEDLVLKLIEANFHIFQDLPNQLKENENFVKKVFSKQSDIYRYLPKSLRENQTFAITAIQKNIHNFKYLPDTLRQSEQFIYCLLRIDGSKICKYDQLKNHKDFVKLAIQQNPNMFLKLSNEFKKDEDLIDLVRHFINLNELQLSKNQKLEMIELDPLNLRYFKDLQNDSIVVNSAIAKNEIACLYANENLLTPSMINALDQYIKQEFILKDVSHDLEKVKIIFQILYHLCSFDVFNSYSSRYLKSIYHNQYQIIIDEIANQYPNINKLWNVNLYHYRWDMSLNTNIIPQTNLSHNHCDIYRKSADHLQYKVLLSKQTLASAEQFTDFINAKIQEFKLNPHKGEILKRNQKHEIEIQLTQSFAPDIHMPKIKI